MTQFKELIFHKMFQCEISWEMVDIINLQLCGALKLERTWKSGHIDLDPV